MNNSFNKDILIQGIARIAGGIISFLSIFVLTYFFEESELGAYNLVLGTINVITSLSTLWLSQSILRFYNNKKQISFILTMMLLCICLSLVLFSISLYFTKYQNSIWAFIYLSLMVFYNIFDALFRKGRKLIYYLSLELLMSIGKLFPMIIIVKIADDYNCIFLSSSIVMFIFIGIIVIKERNVISDVKFDLDLNELKKYIRYGAPLVGLAISNWLLTTSDRYIIRYFENESAVGVYSTVYSLANSIYMMFGLILINAMHPIIINMWESDQEAAIKTVSYTVDNYFLLMIPLVFYGCLKSKILLSMLKGSSYMNHSNVFIWTSLGIFVYGMSLLFHKYYECNKQTECILRYNLISAISNILLNICLIPIFGFSVASFTTFASYLLYLFIVILKTHNIFPVRINRPQLIKVLSSVLLFLFLDFVLFRSESILSFFVEGIIYVLYTLLFYEKSHILDIRSFLYKSIKKLGFENNRI